MRIFSGSTGDCPATILFRNEEVSRTGKAVNHNRATL
jgi:hypothetical protein